MDDDQVQLDFLQEYLKKQNFKIDTALNVEKALDIISKNPPDMVISDIRMPGKSGLDLMNIIIEEYSTIPILLITAQADIKEAINSVKSGAVNYLEKPIDLEELDEIVSHTLKTDKNSVLQDFPKLPENVITRSPEMLNIFKQLNQVAPSDARILITGESGTGKEVIADLIHLWSKRSKAELVKVNCAAIPRNLLESELFGHEKGAFTGATNQRIGYFEKADGGTIFLDEIGELPLELQAKLLRILENGTFKRVGSSSDLSVDIRVIAATNRNLEEEVNKGNFREDLYYRLNVLEFHLPALRERTQDILPLAKHFLTKFSEDKIRISKASSVILQNYDWPGNIRELRNVMERSALLANGNLILPEILPKKITDSASPAQPDTSKAKKGNLWQETEKSLILETLEANNYNRTETAKVLGISRRALINKINLLKEQGFAVDREE